MASESDLVPAAPVVPRRAAALRPLPSAGVELEPTSMLGGRQELNAAVTIPHCLENLESSGVLENFRRLAGAGPQGPAGRFAGMWFAETDLYKTLEAIGWEIGRSGAARPHRPMLAHLADLIEQVQAEDGYLNTYVQAVADEERFARPERTHELYSAGHLIQAAIALDRGAQDRRFLAIARRLADFVVQLDDGTGRPVIDGHPEVETALVELYRHTGTQEYLTAARRQIEARGHGRLRAGDFGSRYFQDHLPVREATEAVGHSVRQLYLAAGVTDVYLETCDESLLRAMERLWDSAFATKMYITGGHGSRHRDEAYGDPFELPPDRAYAETCAAIAAFQWCWRMLLATGEPRYAEEMERALYNNIAASTGLSGRDFFYTNPLQLRTGHLGEDEDAPGARLPWYGCACCPPNIARLYASLHCYLATGDADGLQLHLLHAGTFTGPGLEVTVRTGYPYDGEALVSAAGSGELAVRIPPWAAGATALLGGAELEVRAGRYLRVRMAEGDVLRLSLPMAVRLVAADDRVDAVRGCLALTRGPLVFCVEQADLPEDVLLEQVRLDPSAPIVAERVAADPAPLRLVLNGLVGPSAGALYTAGDAPRLPAEGPAPRTGVRFTAVPYHAWANRGPGAMRVWLPVI